MNGDSAAKESQDGEADFNPNVPDERNSQSNKEKQLFSKTQKEYEEWISPRLSKGRSAEPIPERKLELNHLGFND